MTRAFRDRPYHLFLSHSSADKVAFVEGLHTWLEGPARMKVWYDRLLLHGDPVESISQAMGDSRAALFVVSKSMEQSGWVKDELSFARKEAELNPHFKIVSLRIDESEGPGLLRSHSHINALDGELSPESAALLFQSLWYGDDPDGGRPIYFSRGTHKENRSWNEAVADLLRAKGFRLVCDAPDWRSLSGDEDRLVNLISGCGGLAAVLPTRGDEGGTSPYVVAEIELALRHGLPVLVFAMPGVKPQSSWQFDTHVLDTATLQGGRDAIETRYEDALFAFSKGWRDPERGTHVFVGHSFADSAKKLFDPLRSMVARVTGLPVRVGPWETSKNAQARIIDLIRAAEFCIIDITNVSFEDLNLPDKINYGFNSSVEAGIALGAFGSHEDRLYITCKNLPHKKPFMFDHMDIISYKSELELVGKLRAKCELHRRLVIR